MIINNESSKHLFFKMNEGLNSRFRYHADKFLFAHSKMNGIYHFQNYKELAGEAGNNKLK